MRITPSLPTLALLLALACLSADALAASPDTPCWEEASRRHGIPVELLKAVAHVESSNRARVIARNTNGSLDMGFMQINDWWLPALAKHGIGKSELLDACTNLNVGAWILAQGIERYGYNWQGIGAYGAGTSPKKDHTRKQYANKVFRALERQRPATAGLAGLPPAPAGKLHDRPTRLASQRATLPAPSTPAVEQLVWSVFE